MKKRLFVLILALVMCLTLLPGMALADGEAEAAGEELVAEEDAVLAESAGDGDPAPETAREDSGACGDDLTWTLVDGVLTISGTGDMEDYYSPGTQPWVDDSRTVTQVVIEAGAASIGQLAFDHFQSLKSITIPGSVTSIHNNAFSFCGMTSVTIPESVTSIGSQAFYLCSSLTSIEIPSGVTSIAFETFLGCASLTSVTIPAGVKNIDWGAFDECAALTDVYYGGTEDEWNAITINLSNDPLTGAKIHYNGSSAPAVSGDVNGDGSVTARDALLAARYAAGIIAADALDIAAADMNGDGSITARDALLIARLAAGVA